jgi:hypothetical protein
MHRIKEVVKDVLERFPLTRDDDPMCYVIVSQELKIQRVTVYNLLSSLSYETVRRCRQFNQLKYPELRGKKYEERHKHEEVYEEEFSQYKD